jgi:hypothetical protein
MRITGKIKKMFRACRVEVGLGFDDKIMREAMKEFRSIKPTRKLVLSSFRMVLKSRLTKLAVAAVMVLLGFTGINYFSGGKGVTAIAFAEISHAIRSLPWMHMQSSGFEGWNAPDEHWIGFGKGIYARKWGNGKAGYINDKEHLNYTYEPVKGVVTLTYVNNYIPLDVSSPAVFFESVCKIFEAQNAEIKIDKIEYQNQIVQLQEVCLPGGVNDANTTVLRFYINPDLKLLVAVELEKRDEVGDIILNGEVAFSYPDFGPRSIYDLGVDSEVEVVNNMPTDEYLGILNCYDQAKANATRQYAAIITHREMTTTELCGDTEGCVKIVDVDIKADLNHRLERHFVFKKGERVTQWGAYKKVLGESFESLFSWAEGNYCDGGAMEVRLYDGEYEVSVKRGSSGVWSDQKKIYRPDTELTNKNNLGYIGWPTIGATGQLVEDDYTESNGLVCIEILKQGVVFGKFIRLPMRLVYYLDPDNDYMCVRKVIERRPDAVWQKDESWHDGVEAEKVKAGSITVEDIVEVVYAVNGLWYPKVVEVRVADFDGDSEDLELRTIKRVYLELEDIVEPSLFDLDSLP